jgi:hypothetical protein
LAGIVEGDLSIAIGNIIYPTYTIREVLCKPYVPRVSEMKLQVDLQFIGILLQVIDILLAISHRHGIIIV